MRRLCASLLAICLALCLCLTGCGDDGTGMGFRFPIAAEPNGLDPQTATDAAAVTVIATLFEGLTAITPDGDVVDAAATYTLSADGRTYTFHLKESYWSTLKIRGEETPWDNPTRVTADDYLFAIQRGVDPTTGSPLAAEYDPIQNAAAIRRGEKPLSDLGVKAVDANTLVITLEQADASFPSRLAGTPYMPCNRAFFEYTGGRYGLEKEYLLTNGAFWLAAWNHDESLLMYKYESYRDAAQVSPEAVRYVIGTTDPVTALQSGDLDGAPLTEAQKTALEGQVTTVPLQDTVRYLWFNTTADPFTVGDIRRALRDSIDWTAVTNYMSAYPDEPMAKGYLPPDTRVVGDLYHNPELATAVTPVTDVAAAKTALQNGLATLFPDGGKLRFEVLAADDTVSADIARSLVQSWQKNLEIYPTLTLLPQAELDKRVKSGNYQAAIYTHTVTGLTGGENLSFFATDGVGNLSRLTDAAVDAAITAAESGGRAQLEALDNLLWQVCPAVPLTNPTRYYGFAHTSSVRVTDVEVRPFSGGRWGSPLSLHHAKKWD